MSKFSVKLKCSVVTPHNRKPFDVILEITIGQKGLEHLDCGLKCHAPKSNEWAAIEDVYWVVGTCMACRSA